MEKKNNLLITVVAVIEILVLLLEGFIVYDKVLRKEKNPINNSGNQEEKSNNEVNTEQGEKVNLNINVKGNIKSGDYESIVLNSFFISGKDITSKISNNSYNTYNLEKYDDFVVFNYSNGGTCGFENYTILLFDYNGNLIYQNNDINNQVDRLVYAGEYSFSNNKCSKINQYKSVISKIDLELTYQGNGKFKVGEQKNVVKLIDNEYYRHKFNGC